MQAEERGEADERSHSETCGDVAGVGIQGQYFLELQFKFVNRYHVGLDCRQLYDFEALLVNLIGFTITIISAIVPTQDQSPLFVGSLFVVLMVF